MLFFLVIEKWRHNAIHLRLLNGRIKCEIFNKLDKYLMLYVEIVSVFFLELPVSFNGMVTMKNKFHSKQILLETKMFLSTVAYASNTASFFNWFQQNLLQSHKKAKYKKAWNKLMTSTKSCLILQFWLFILTAWHRVKTCPLCYNLIYNPMSYIISCFNTVSLEAADGCHTK